MQRRKVAGASGRPAGTDGSHFSYRTVVESRYTKVAKGKSQLYKLIVAQAIMQLGGLLSLVQPVAKEKSTNSSSVISALSLFIRGLGLSRSKLNLLRFFVVASSAAASLSMASLSSRNVLIEIIRVSLQRQMNKFLLLENVGFLLGESHTLMWIYHKFVFSIGIFVDYSILTGVLLHILAISTTVPLVQNMSPPKKAS